MGWGIWDLLAQWAWVQAAWLGKATTIPAWVASKGVSTWVQLHLRPPSPSPCMGPILKAMGILFKATVNLAMDLGLLNLAIPHRRTPLLRRNLQGNPSLPPNIQSTPATTFLPTSTSRAPQPTTWLLPGSTSLFLPAPSDASISSTNRAADAI